MLTEAGGSGKDLLLARVRHKVVLGEDAAIQILSVIASVASGSWVTNLCPMSASNHLVTR